MARAIVSLVTPALSIIVVRAFRGKNDYLNQREQDVSKTGCKYQCELESGRERWDDETLNLLDRALVRILNIAAANIWDHVHMMEQNISRDQVVTILSEYS